MKNSSQGYSLLEITVTLVAMGVLVSAALPRFSNTVELSRSAEALNTISAISLSVERCGAINAGDLTTCLDFTTIDIDDPNGVGGAHFTYAMAASGAAYTITATRNGLDGGNIGDTLAVDYLPDPADVSGTGAFSSLQ